MAAYHQHMPASASRTLRKPPSRYHHGDLRRALLAEAVRTIARDGVEGLTLREVGARLGVSRTALYRHFADKSSLLAAVAREGFERFTAALRDAWGAHEGTRTGLERMGEAYVRFALEHPAHYRVMFGDYRHLCEKDAELTAVAEGSFRVLLDAIVSLQEANVIRRDDPRMQAHLVWSLVHGLAMLAIDGLGPPADAPGALADVVHFAIRRLGTGLDAPERKRR